MCVCVCVRAYVHIGLCQNAFLTAAISVVQFPSYVKEMALETDTQDNGSKEDDGGTKDNTANTSDSSLTHLTNNTRDTCVNDTEENPVKERDCGSEDITGNEEKVCAAEETGNTENKSAEAGDNVRTMVEGSDSDPPSVDLCDRLRAENGAGGSDNQWDDYNACDDLRRACKRLSCSERQF